MNGMRIGVFLLVGLPLLAQSPAINSGGVVLARTGRPGLLTAGTSFTIYGRQLGPHDGCHGSGERDLCGVRVLVGGTPAELLYVQDHQINARVPPDLPQRESVRGLTVTFEGRSGTDPDIRTAPDMVKISLDGTANARGPVWIRVPTQYPEGIVPWEFKCDSFEVRKDGKALERFTPYPPGFGMVGSGLVCGFLGLGAEVNPHPGRLPLHLQFVFPVAGTYEVRYTRRGDPWGSGAEEVRAQSEWTRITVGPAVVNTDVGVHPQNPADLLSNFLPNALALRNDACLNLILEYLYHPSTLVRRYAGLALRYWPEAYVAPRLFAIMKTNGPTDSASDYFRGRAAELVEPALPFLDAGDLVLLRGALTVLRDALIDPAVSEVLRGEAETALIRAAEHTIEMADAQTAIDYTSLLGAAHDPRAHALLWTLSAHEKVREQALLAILWKKNRDDIPRLTALLITLPENERRTLREAMDRAFGDR